MTYAAFDIYIAFVNSSICTSIHKRGRSVVNLGDIRELKLRTNCHIKFVPEVSHEICRVHVIIVYCTKGK